MTKYRLVIDLETDRIIWYTDNFDDFLQTDPTTAIAEYTGELPEGISPGNCFNYVLRDKSITTTAPKIPAVVSLLEQNRQSILEFSTSTFNNKLLKKLPINDYVRFVEEFTLQESKDFLAGNITEVKWLSLVKNKLAIKSDKEAAVSILQSRKLLEDTLYKVFELKQYFETRIKEAGSSDELFSIKQEITTVISAI